MKSDRNNEIARVCSCLLMFKPSPFGNDLSWFEQADFESAHLTQLTALPAINPKEDLEQLNPAKHGMWLMYVLDAGEDKLFLNFWTAMTSADWPKNLTAAAQRLIRAQRRRGFDRDEDRLIDLIIAFEALVLNKNEHGKQKQMSSRFSNLIGGRQKQQIKDDLSLAYDLRNDAVHDGYFDSKNVAQIPNYPMQIPTFIMNVERYLREGMKNYVALNNKGQSKDQIIASL